MVAGAMPLSAAAGKALGATSAGAVGEAGGAMGAGVWATAALTLTTSALSVRCSLASEWAESFMAASHSSTMRASPISHFHFCENGDAMCENPCKSAHARGFHK